MSYRTRCLMIVSENLLDTSFSVRPPRRVSTLGINCSLDCSIAGGGRRAPSLPTMMSIANELPLNRIHNHLSHHLRTAIHAHPQTDPAARLSLLVARRLQPSSRRSLAPQSPDALTATLRGIYLPLHVEFSTVYLARQECSSCST